MSDAVTRLPWIRYTGVYEAALDTLRSYIHLRPKGRATAWASLKSDIFPPEGKATAHRHACRVNERPSITTPAPRMSGTKNTNESSQLLSATEAFELTTNSILSL